MEGVSFMKRFLSILCLGVMLFSTNLPTASAISSQDIGTIVGGLINIFGGKSTSGTTEITKNTKDNTIIFASKDKISKMFFLAMKNKDYAAMQEQIDKGFKINAIYTGTENGWGERPEDAITPFYTAFINKDRETMQWLLEHGADVSGFTRGGNHISYIVEAAGWFDLETVQYLHNWGADINSISTAKGLPNQPLHDNALNFMLDTDSIQGENSEHAIAISRYLIDNSIDLTHRNKNGDTPLHQIVICNEWDVNFTVINYLLDAGANIQAKDKQGRTVLDRAVDANHYEFVKILRAHL